MREKVNAFVLQLEEKYWAVRQLVPVKDKQVPSGVEDLFDNEAEWTKRRMKNLKLGD